MEFKSININVTHGTPVELQFKRSIRVVSMNIFPITVLQRTAILDVSQGTTELDLEASSLDISTPPVLTVTGLSQDSIVSQDQNQYSLPLQFDYAIGAAGQSPEEGSEYMRVPVIMTVQPRVNFLIPFYRDTNRLNISYSFVSALQRIVIQLKYYEL